MIFGLLKDHPSYCLLVTGFYEELLLSVLPPLWSSSYPGDRHRRGCGTYALTSAVRRPHPETQTLEVVIGLPAGCGFFWSLGGSDPLVDDPVGGPSKEVQTGGSETFSTDTM